MSSREFAAWLAFDRIEPIGGARQDILTALLASVIANASGGKKDGGAFGVADFLPTWAQPEPDPEVALQAERQKQEQIAAAMLGLVKASGGDRKTGG